MATVQFKFKDGVQGPQQEKVLKDLADRGLGKAHRPFAELPALRSIFSVDVPDAKFAEHVANLLGKFDQVEFAEVAPLRKLMHH
jgi:hypothetical protein